MTQTDESHPPDRSYLRFEEEVLEHFVFLTQQGFHVLRSGPTFVRYGSAKLFIDLYHGRQSYEIGLTITSVEALGTTHSVAEIFSICGKAASRSKHYVALTPMAVVKGVRMLAELVQPCLTAEVLEDPQLFDRLQEQRALWLKGVVHEQEWAAARALAEEAFRRKDYATVVRSLQPFRSSLTAVYLGKLLYAEKRLVQ